eukprot:COSAG01_NODE_3059_length_6658_cov_3.106178_4_plen_297_part_00
MSIGLLSRSLAGLDFLSQPAAFQQADQTEIQCQFRSARTALGRAPPWGAGCHCAGQAAGAPRAAAGQGGSMCTGRVGMGSSPPARLLALLLLLAVAPRDSTPQQGAAPPAIDACGCRGGSGWSLATGRGCCAAGLLTVPDQHMSSCRSAMGNTDCAPPGDANPAIAVTPAIGAPAAAGAPNDACGCPTGYGWSLTTGRGCCKPGSLTSEAEQSTCHSTHGNMDCAAVAGSAPAAAPAPLVAAPAATTVPTQHASGEVMANGPISSVPVGQLEPEGIMDEAAAPAGEARFSCGGCSC